MKKDRDNKERKITRRMQTKLVILFFIIVLALVGLCVRLTYINMTNDAQYSKQVLAQQQYETKTIPFRRGDIVDRNGITLATSIKVYNLIIDPKIMLSDGGKYLEPTIAALCNYFDYTETEIRDIVSENSGSRYYRLKKGLTYDETEDFIGLSEGNMTPVPVWFKDSDGVAYRWYNIQGVWFEEEYVRYYPYDSLACDVVGFTNAGNAGSWGLEEQYNSLLNGTDGRKYGYLNSDSDVESVVQAAVDGSTIVSTIDVNIQRIAEAKIEEFQNTVGSTNCAVVVMNPNNGEVYAMSSWPFYNLNNPRDLTGLFTAEELAAMNDEDMLNAYYDLWRNFCISDTYEPGSTAKLFTVAAALEENIVDESRSFNCKGHLVVGGWTINCNNRYGHKKINLRQSVMYSCNVAMMELAEQIGAKTFARYQRLFGIGELSGIDLPGEASAAGLHFTADKMKAADLATNSFGQNFNMTMIQMAAAYASIINGGYYYEPHVMKRVVSAEGSTVSENAPLLVRQTISNVTSGILKGYLESTVTEGTGKNAAIAGYSIGGKTGTAEKGVKDKKNYLVSFIGFSPVENPEVLVYVIIDEPAVEKQANSTYASGLARDIMKEILPYLNIYSSIKPEVDDTPAAEPETTVQEPEEPEEPADPSYSEIWDGDIIEEETPAETTTT